MSNDCNCNIRVQVREDPPISVNVEGIYNYQTPDPYDINRLSDWKQPNFEGLYLLCDKSLNWGKTYVAMVWDPVVYDDTPRSTIERGHIVGNTFVVDESRTVNRNGDNNAVNSMIIVLDHSNIQDDYVIYRIKPYGDYHITRCMFTSQNPNSLNARLTKDSHVESCIERYGRLPYGRIYLEGTGGANRSWSWGGMNLRKDNTYIGNGYLYYSYFQSPNLTEIDLSNSNVYNSSSAYAFHKNYTLKTVALGNMSNVTSTSNMFYDCNDLESVTFTNNSLANTSTVASMFQYCYNLKGITLGNISATTTNSMFYRCDNCKSITVGNLSSATNTGSMFQTCYGLEDLTIGDFSSSETTNNMFNACSSLKNLIVNGSTCSVSFSLNASSHLTHDSVINIFNALPEVETSPTLTLHRDAKARVSLEEMEIATNKGWQIA